MRFIHISLLLGAALLSTQSMAHDHGAGELHIDQPWSRALPPVAPTGAAYLSIENRGQHSDRLLAADTPIAGHAELHEHVHQDGLMKMQQIDSIEIAPGERVEFTPGGHHIMLFDLKQPLVAGSSYPMTLTFEQAGEVGIEVMVRGEEDKGQADDAHHSTHGHEQHGHHH